MLLHVLACLLLARHAEGFRNKFGCLGSCSRLATSLKITTPDAAEASRGKTLTKEIMSHFSDRRLDQKKELVFKRLLFEAEERGELDGMHMMTLLFQSARSRRKVKNLMPVPLILKSLSSWDREWTERDISTFVYGLRSVQFIDKTETDLLALGARKISESKAKLSSRAIGNALYGLQDITSDTENVAELCLALALKINDFDGELNGQDIGIGLYGLQGMSSDIPAVRKLIAAMADKIKQSEIELDAQALGNTLYGLQVIHAFTIVIANTLRV